MFSRSRAIQAAFGVDKGVVETIAHYTAAKYFCPQVDFILDIGSCCRSRCPAMRPRHRRQGPPPPRWQRRGVLFLGGPLYYCKGLRRRFQETLKLDDEHAVFPEYGRFTRPPHS